MPPAHLRLAALFPALLAAVALAGCFAASSGGSTGPDAGADVSFPFEGGEDVTLTDSAPGPEAGLDATTEAAPDTSVPPVEAGAEAATDAPTDAAPPEDAPAEASAGSVYVNPTTGSDSNAGTQGAPFQTIAHAASVLSAADAGAGQTVYLASGTYDAANQGALWGTFARPTFVVGTGSANVILSGTHANEIMIFAQGGGISGVTFQNTWEGFQIQGGTFTSSDVVLDGLPGFNVPALSFVNGAVATLSATIFTNLNPAAGGQDFPGIYADNAANVTWHATGNTITAAVGHGAFVFERGGAQVAIDGLAMNGYSGYGAQLYDQAQLTLSNSTWAGVAPAGGVCGIQACASIWMGGSQTGVPTGTLVLSGVTITGSPSSAVAYTTAPNTGAVSLSFTNSHLDANAFDGLWISGSSNAALAMNVVSNGTTFTSDGIAGVTSTVPVTMSITGGAMNNDGSGAAVTATGQMPGGVLLQATTGLSTLTLRNVGFAGNTGNPVAIANAPGTVVDLGTTASAGGNTFAGVPVGAGVGALNLQALVTAQAVGNTWIPNAQGADASGHYTSATTLAGPANGPNFFAPAGASVVMK
jgi:hypothetical protein